MRTFAYFALSVRGFACGVGATVLRSIRIETATVGAICESLELLRDANGNLPPGLECLGKPLLGCEESLYALASLLENVKSSTLLRMTWPTMDRRARGLLDDLTRHKSSV